MLVLEVVGSTGYRFFFQLSLGGVMQRVLDPEKCQSTVFSYSSSNTGPQDLEARPRLGESWGVRAGVEWRLTGQPLVPPVLSYMSHCLESQDGGEDASTASGC